MKTYIKLTGEERAVIGNMPCYRKLLPAIGSRLERLILTIYREIHCNDDPNRAFRMTRGQWHAVGGEGLIWAAPQPPGR